MRNAYVQIDGQGGIIRPASPLPTEFKGQGNFNNLPEKVLNKFGWYKTNISIFQAQLGVVSFDKNYNAIMNEDVHLAFVGAYYGSMKTGIWNAVARGIEYEGCIYKYNYHNQLQLLNASIFPGCKIARYENGIKTREVIKPEKARDLLALQIERMDSLIEEYDFYVNKLKNGFDSPEEYNDLYFTFKSALKDERQ